MTDTMKTGWTDTSRASTPAVTGAEISHSPNLGTTKAEAMRHKCVLIVDRDREALDGLTYLLESMGYGVIATADTREALEIAERGLPDAVLIDIGSPHLEGLSVAHGLREIAGNRPLLLIALTGWGQPQYREMALSAGFDVHWVKPVSADQINFLLSMTFV
ncbi:MAG TPA: response regulator [Trinickia sp.]|jgi:CheY-like chemotaxis protein|uniref:response regulator n=1 Tax=Trinickia sp. TaxID=2571163 RepID=UPI002C5281B1|nr:response regulator [Trinickia sp.]HTI18228.1 response regulator [Trinickia sp.]